MELWSEVTNINHLKENNTNNMIQKKDRFWFWNIKVKYIARDTHITCGKKNVLMVLGRFMNAFGSGSDFFDKDIYQVCSNLLHILMVNHGVNLLFASTDNNPYGFPHLE